MAYAGLEESFRKYQDKMKESLGEETVEKIIDHSNEKALDEAKKQYYDETGREFQLKPEEFMRELGVSPYAVVFDQNAGAWEGNEDYSLMILHAQENYANDILRTRGYLLLNEVYKGLGLPQTSAGAVVGWVYDSDDGDGIVEFGNFEVLNYRDYDPVLGREVTKFILDFNVDGVIWDQIDRLAIR